jgi:hypothetical protein
MSNPTPPSPKSRHSFRPSVGAAISRENGDATMAKSAATNSGYSRRDFPNTLTCLLKFADNFIGFVSRQAAHRVTSSKATSTISTVASSNPAGNGSPCF